MKSVKQRAVYIILLCVFLGAAVSTAGAMEFDRLEFQYELLRIGVDASDLEGSVEAVWTHALGLRLPFSINGRAFQFVPALTLTSLYYFYDEGNSRAVPVDVEWRELTTVVPQLDAALRWRIREGEKASYFFESGLGLELPVPIKSWDSGDSSGQILPSLYSDLRFLRPLIAVQAETPFLDRLSLLFRLSAYVPLYHLWDGADVIFLDGLTVGLSLGCWFR
ncbi:MAG: hypothetical protein SVR04_01975 [Spirochaetota bacterium]|nr:hypothetical protein [Spirochaetota bacterium]